MHYVLDGVPDNTCITFNRWQKSRNIIFQKDIIFSQSITRKDFLGPNQDNIQQQDIKIFCIEMPQCFEGFLKVFHTSIKVYSNLTG